MSGTTFTWNGGSGNDWNTASNWTPNGIPNAANAVAIDATGPNLILSGGSTDIVQSLTMANTNLLEVGGAGTSDGTLTAGSIVSSAGILAVVTQNSVITATGGWNNSAIIGGGGTIAADIANSGSVIGDGGAIGFGSLVISGNVNGTGITEIDEGSTIQVTGTIAQAITAGGAFAGPGAGPAGLLLDSGFSGVIYPGSINMVTGQSLDLFLKGVTATSAAISPDAGTLTVVTGTGTDIFLGSYTGDSAAVAASSSNPGYAEIDVVPSVVCFARGTRIATPNGPVAVEHLSEGDTVLTARGETQRITWVGRRRLECRRHPEPLKVWPVRIRAGAFGPSLPERDLLVSPQHAIFAEGVLIPARYLVNGTSVVIEDVRTVEYYHVELPHHDLLLAEGLPAESYLENGDRDCFENGEAPLRLHPDFSAWTWDARSCADLKVTGREVERVKALLARRAGRRPARHAAAG